ncbi:hypothetical protein, partial [Escherichia coli]
MCFSRSVELHENVIG